MTSDSPRAQLIHIETDRRLGHEWDEWDGKPLPGNGDFSAPPGVFFRYAGVTLALVAAGTAALIFVLAPRLAAGGAGPPRRLWPGPATGPHHPPRSTPLLLPFALSHAPPLAAGMHRARAH